MIFLDADDRHWFAARSRQEMARALLAYLPDKPDDEQLAALAAACLKCEPLDVMISTSEPKGSSNATK